MSFFTTLSDKTNLENASPADIRMFLAHKDLHGKTQVHVMKLVLGANVERFQVSVRYIAHLVLWMV